ncbi:MAG: porin [Gemmatimonadales bacterium]|nr:porin [Gemmatimonadales bacterium]
MSAVRSWVCGIVLSTGTVASPLQGWAQEEVSDSAGRSLEARVDELDQQVRILQRLRELAAESLATAAKDRQTVTANGKDGFSLKSADGKYTLKLRGYAHADARFFASDDAKAIPNTFFLRRARPIIEASVGKYFDFRLMPDFAQGTTTLFDAYWEGKFSPAFAVRAGKYKPPVGFERLQSATDITFAERGLPTNLAPNRDVGLQIAGDVSAGLFAYQVGIFNGVADLANGDGDGNDSKELAARIYIQPVKQGSLKGLGFGVSSSTGEEMGTATATGLAGYRSASQQTVFRYRSDAVTPANTVIAEGRRTRVSPHAYLGLGSLGVLGEFILSSQEVRAAATTAKLNHRAWQASAGYFLTGEQAGFRSPTPKKPFDLKEGTWGAFELAARYGELDIDDDAFPTFANPTSAVSKAKGIGMGVNWHLSKQIKVVVNYEHTTFEGGGPTGDRPSEDFVVTRFQHAF